MSAPPLSSGLRQRCPECGAGRLYSGYLRLADACPLCGADFRIADAGDGPAVFVIFVVGALVTPLVLILQLAFHAPLWAALLAGCVATLGLSLWLLPLFKSVLFALQWRHHASEAGVGDVDAPER